MYKVGEFEFATVEEARAARKEAEGVKYIRSQTDMNDPNTVLKLYGRLIQKEVFETPVGFAFLAEMQAYLRDCPFVEDEEIMPLPTPQKKEPPKEEARSRKREKRAKREKKPKREKRARSTEKAGRPAKTKSDRQINYRTGFWISTFCAGVFAAALIGMFVITALSADNVNIINYENALIDKYELWEQELNEREADLREREAALSGEDYRDGENAE